MAAKAVTKNEIIFENFQYVKAIPCAVIEQAYHDARAYIRELRRQRKVPPYKNHRNIVNSNKDAYDFLMTRRFPNFCKHWCLNLDTESIRRALERRERRGKSRRRKQNYIAP